MCTTSGPGAHPASQFHQEETERGVKASCSAQGRGLQDEGRCGQEDRTPPGRHLQAQRRGKQDLSAAGLTCERGERERGREGQTDRDSHRQEQANRQRDRDRDWLSAVTLTG